MKFGAEKYTLATNINFVAVDGLRLDCNAILIEERVVPLFGEETYTQLRGFGPNSAWPVFTYRIDSGEFSFTIKPAQSNSVLFMGDGDAKPKPVFGGSIMELSNGKQFFLQAEDMSHPLDLTENETDICKIWEILERKCEEYWQSPNMPHLSWYPPAKRKATVKSERRKEG